MDRENRNSRDASFERFSADPGVPRCEGQGQDALESRRRSPSHASWPGEPRRVGEGRSLRKYSSEQPGAPRERDAEVERNGLLDGERQITYSRRTAQRCLRTPARWEREHSPRTGQERRGRSREYTPRSEDEVTPRRESRYSRKRSRSSSRDPGRNALSIPTRDKEEFLEVTVLPAGHSLGSVMYLFEYENQKILFTGDFRISKNDVAKYKHLQNNGEPIQIDALYVDTTFQDKPYIPKRSEVVSNLIPHISKWLAENEKNKVVLSVSAMFGYEGACNQIYDEIKIKANVNEDDWAIYRQFPKQIYGVTNEESRIALRKKNKERIPEHTLDVVFSALSWTSPNLDEKCLVKEGLQRIKVCYSTHCGRDELIHFINYLKPRRIKGFPEDLKENNSKLSRRSIFTDNDSDANENFEISPKKRKIVRDNNGKENCKKSEVVKRRLGDVLDWDK